MTAFLKYISIAPVLLLTSLVATATFLIFANFIAPDSLVYP